MEIERTALMREIEAITSQPVDNLTYYHWRCEILANEKVVVPLKLISIDFIRDYAGAFGDEIYLELFIGAGTYSHLVYPFKEDLRVTLIRDPIGRVDTDADVDKQSESFTFRAAVNKEASSVIEGETRYGSNAFTGDLTDILYVKFQAVDPLLEQLRMQTTGGVMRDTTTADALKYILTDVSAKIDLDEENKIHGVDMYEPSNKEPQKHIVIPHGTKLVDVPDYLQQKCSGIYNAGLGFYLQHRNWFVYPLFDFQRFDKSLKTLTLINVPKNRMPGIEATYRKTTNQVIALCTGSVRHRDDSERQQLNEGNGIRFLDARKVMDGFAAVEGNRMQVQRGENNSEFVGAQRKTGLNNVQTTPTAITSNPFQELSRLARRSGAMLQCEWQNSSYEDIYPGMPVKYMYAVNGEVQEVMGVVLGAHHYVETTPGPTARRYLCTTVLTLCVDRKIDWSSVEETEETA